MARVCAGLKPMRLLPVRLIQLCSHWPAVPTPGTLVKIHYTGKIEATGEVYGQSRGPMSLTKDEPYVFKIGSRAVIPGWNEGVSTMRVGGKRTLSIPASLAYGELGYLSGNAVRIPPDAKLEIECELLGFSNGLEWTSRVFSAENAGPWAILVIVGLFQGVASAPEGSLPSQVGGTTGDVVTPTHGLPVASLLRLLCVRAAVSAHHSLRKRFAIPEQHSSGDWCGE